MIMKVLNSPRELQQRLNPRVMDNNPLLQHQGCIQDDGLHPELRHHIWDKSKNMVEDLRSCDIFH